MRWLSRRQFVGGAAGLGLLAGCGRLPGQAPQTVAKIPRVGYLVGGADTVGVGAVQQRLQELGYIEGRNLVIEWRRPGAQAAQVQEHAAELVALPVDVIVTSGTFTAEAARAATATIPIVMVYPFDPVAAGLVASLARPGGNVTGLTLFLEQLGPKRLELLKDTVPTISRVAVPHNPDVPVAPMLQPGGSLQVAAQTLGIHLVQMDLRAPSDLDAALGAAVRASTDALLWGGTGGGGGFPGPEFQSRVLALAAQYHLPVMTGFVRWAKAGALMAYSARWAAQFDRAAEYVDRILKGAKPADLPVEQPREFDFAVNMKTAQALGITFPNEIMLQVTEVIQ
jgi:putative tryptophan/tyrosine transport system substrate-binding protein